MQQNPLMNGSGTAPIPLPATMAAIRSMSTPDGTSFSAQSRPSNTRGTDCHEAVFETGPITPSFLSRAPCAHMLSSQSGVTTVSLLSSTAQGACAARKPRLAARV